MFSERTDTLSKDELVERLNTTRTLTSFTFTLESLKPVADNFLAERQFEAEIPVQHLVSAYERAASVIIRGITQRALSEYLGEGCEEEICSTNPILSNEHFERIKVSIGEIAMNTFWYEFLGKTTEEKLELQQNNGLPFDSISQSPVTIDIRVSPDGLLCLTATANTLPPTFYEEWEHVQTEGQQQIGFDTSIEISPDELLAQLLEGEFETEKSASFGRGLTKSIFHYIAPIGDDRIAFITSLLDLVALETLSDAA